jgi:hypothetical protein
MVGSWKYKQQFEAPKLEVVLGSQSCVLGNLQNPSSSTNFWSSQQLTFRRLRCSFNVAVSFSVRTILILGIRKLPSFAVI